MHVSTDDPEILEVAEHYGASCLGLRDPALANDIAGFIDLIRLDMPRFCAARGDDEVLFSLATAPLVPAHLLRQAHKVYGEERPDVLMSCEPTSPWWAMTQKPDGFWWPLYPDKVLINSQDLPRALVDAGLFYFMHQPTVARYESVKLVPKLRAFEVPARYNGDIDTPDDWDLLEYKYNRLQAKEPR